MHTIQLDCIEYKNLIVYNDSIIMQIMQTIANIVPFAGLVQLLYCYICIYIF